MTAAATPAIWPMGSMAIVFRLPNRMPMPKKPVSMMIMNSQNGGTPFNHHASTKNSAYRALAEVRAQRVSACMP